MSRTQKNRFSLQELSQKTDIPPRTIRFYISKGLLAGPVQAGRNAVYTDEHLRRLKEIKEKQKTGFTLQNIAAEDGAMPGVLPEPDNWVHYSLDEDVRFLIKSGVSPWRMKEIKKVIEEIIPKIKKLEKRR